MSSMRENGAPHAIYTLRLANQLSGSDSEFQERDKKTPWVKLNYIIHIQKGKERVKTQRKPTQLKGK